MFEEYDQTLSLESVTMTEVNDLIVNLEGVTTDSSTIEDKTLQASSASDNEGINNSPRPSPNGSPPGSLQRRPKHVSFNEETTANDKQKEGPLDDEVTN